MTATTSGVGRRVRLNASYGSWDLIWDHVHRVLVVNVGLAALNLPLLAALQTAHQPWRYPVPFVLLSLGIGPSLAAAFGYLRAADDDERAPAMTLLRAYRRLFVPALLTWSPPALLTAVAAADAVYLRHSALGLAMMPALAVVVLVASSTAVLAMAGLADGGRRSVARTLLESAYALLLRRPLAVVNLALLAVALAIVNQMPLIGLAVVPGCVLFVLWRNARVMLAPRGPDVSRAGEADAAVAG